MLATYIKLANCAQGTIALYLNLKFEAKHLETYFKDVLPFTRKDLSVINLSGFKPGKSCIKKLLKIFCFNQLFCFKF